MLSNNTQKELFEMEFDKELSFSDAFGKSAILCNYEFAQKLLNICNEPKNCYKGHDIYINNKINDYIILPLKLDLNRFVKLEDYNAE